MNSEEVKQIAQATAREVINNLHRYTVAYQEPDFVIQGLEDSIREELTAADWYRRRATNARLKHNDEKTASLYEEIAKDEDQDHYPKFNQRVIELERLQIARAVSSPDIDKAELQTVIEINDEKKAAEEYEQVAAMLTKIDLPGDAHLVKQIAEDERRHRTVLEVVLNNIRHKRGEGRPVKVMVPA